VHDEARLDAVAGGSLGEKLGRQVLAFLRRDQPADNVPAEQIDDHVDVQEDALLERGQLGDVPGPYLVGRSRGERGFDVGMRKPLIPALFRLSERREHAIESANGREVDAATEQLREHLHRRLVHELRRVHGVDDGLALVVAQPPRAGSTLPRCSRRHRASAAVQRRPARAHGGAGRDDGNARLGKILYQVHQVSSSLSGSASPRTSCAFFCKAMSTLATCSKRCTKPI